MFGRKKQNNRDLDVPSEVTSDANAQEVLRAWVADGGLVCSLRPTAWDDASSWGIVLADVARHVADARFDLNGADRDATLASIRELFKKNSPLPQTNPPAASSIEISQA